MAIIAAAARLAVVGPLKILVVMTSLQKGGAELVSAALCNGWRAEGRAVGVATVLDAADSVGLDPAVPVAHLRHAGATGSALTRAVNNLRYVRRLRRHIRDTAPDVVVAHGDRTNVLALLAASRLRNSGRRGRAHRSTGSRYRPVLASLAPSRLPVGKPYRRRQQRRDRNARRHLRTAEDSHHRQPGCRAPHRSRAGLGSRPHRRHGPADAPEGISICCSKPSRASPLVTLRAH